MEIRELRAFLEVAREENMTRAAGNLHMSQPSLSKLIKSLEHELGAKLFVRRSFGLTLTKEGRVLRERARDLVGMANRIEDEFASLGNITGGTLYFGLAESYQIQYLARQIKILDVYKRQDEHLATALRGVMDVPMVDAAGFEGHVGHADLFAGDRREPASAGEILRVGVVRLAHREHERLCVCGRNADGNRVIVHCLPLFICLFICRARHVCECYAAHCCMQQMMKNHVLHSRCAYGLRGLRLQIPREEPGDRVERDRIEIVIQVGVIGPRDDQQFLVRRIHAMLELLIRCLLYTSRCV